jgi:5,10-methylenetetrahydromethanopterin reductase
MDTPMEIGFFFWPYTPALIRTMAAAAQRYRYDVVGVADTPGVAMDPWVAATLLAEAVTDIPLAICVSNLVSRHPAVSAAAIASLALLCGGKAVLGIGAGHSGVRNLGLRSSTAGELARGVRFIKDLLRGGASTLGDTTAALPWVTQVPQVFVAASHDRALTAAGAVADGVYINYGLHRENVCDAEAIVRRSAEAAGRHPDAIEIWQIAALDCSDDGESSRRALGTILAFLTGYIVGARDPVTRGVPPELSAAVKELCAHYSTRPGQADADLVARLGLFEYLARRHAICGTPDECLTQLAAARAAGVHRLMLSVSLAADPARTVELFGERVLPAVRSWD